jgi:hypothetical protein
VEIALGLIITHHDLDRDLVLMTHDIFLMFPPSLLDYLENKPALSESCFRDEGSATAIGSNEEL